MAESLNLINEIASMFPEWNTSERQAITDEITETLRRLNEFR